MCLWVVSVNVEISSEFFEVRKLHLEWLSKYLVQNCKVDGDHPKFHIFGSLREATLLCRLDFNKKL